MKKQREFIQWFGLLGVVSLLSYTAAVVFAPRAYPGYNWITQAVSDLSAADAPSRLLWERLSALYTLCGIVSVTLTLVYVQGKLTGLVRAGIILFAAMSWISAAGYALFPLSASGYAGTLTDIVHVYVVTIAVVGLSIVSLALIILGGFRNGQYPSLAVWAAIALGMMMLGAVGTGMFPAVFGILERCSVFAAAGFTAVLGMYLFTGFNPTKPAMRRS